jgi:hypothetical protein
MKIKKITVKIQSETKTTVAKKGSHTPHDNYFIGEYSNPENGKQLIRTAFRNDKKTLNILKLETLQLETGTLFDDSNNKFHPDLVFSCQTIYGKNALIFFILEHKSYHDRHIPIQVGINYYQLLNTLWHSGKYKGKKLPYIIPIVVLQGNRAKYIPLTELFNKKFLGIPRLQDPDVVILHLSEITEEMIKKDWPRSFPLLILKEYRNPKLLDIMSAGIVDIQRNHNSKNEYDKLISHTISYIADIKKRKVESIKKYIAKQGGDIVSMEAMMERTLGEYFEDRYKAKEKRLQAQEKRLNDLYKDKEKRLQAQEKRYKDLAERNILKNLRNSVKVVLNQRFGTIPRSLSGRLCHIEKPKTLNMLLAAAAKCDNLSTFGSIVDATK